MKIKAKLATYLAALAAASCLLAASPVLAGGYFTWTDENGIKHFAKTAPIDANSQAHTFGNERDFHTRYITPDTAVPAKSDKAEDPAPTKTAATDPGDMPLVYEKDPERCAHAQKNLRTLDSDRPIRVTDENGAKSLLSAEQKEQQRNLAREVMRVRC